MPVHLVTFSPASLGPLCADWWRWCATKCVGDHGCAQCGQLHGLGSWIGQHREVVGPQHLQLNQVFSDLQHVWPILISHAYITCIHILDFWNRWFYLEQLIIWFSTSTTRHHIWAMLSLGNQECCTLDPTACNLGFPVNIFWNHNSLPATCRLGWLTFGNRWMSSGGHSREDSCPPKPPWIAQTLSFLISPFLSISRLM